MYLNKSQAAILDKIIDKIHENCDITLLEIIENLILTFLRAVCQKF